MKRLVIRSPKALANFRRQIRHMALASERNADLVAARLETAANRLADFPTGRAGRVKNTFEKYVANTSHFWSI